MISPDGVRLDFPAGTVVLNHVAFKAAVATYVDNRMCPPNARCEHCEPLKACVLGGRNFIDDDTWDRGWTVYHPMPNGVLAGIEVSELCSVTLSLYSPTLLVTDDMRTPWPMMTVGRTIVPSMSATGYPINGSVTSWNGCDPEWLAEFIVRLSRFAVDRPEGPRVKLVSIRDMRVRPKGMVLA